MQGPYILNTAPADCSDLATRVSADKTTRTTGRVRVYRWAGIATFVHLRFACQHVRC